MFSKICGKGVRFIQRKYWQGIYKNLAFKSIGDSVTLDNRISFRQPEYISIGSNVYLGPDSRICCYDSYQQYKYKPNLIIGNHIQVTSRITILCAGNISIGDDCLFASGIFISDENHGTNPSLRYIDNPLIVKDITIGRNVWICEKAIILPGTHIGDNCIVGAGAVVTGNIPPYSMVGGVPAKILKQWNTSTMEWE